MSYVLFFMQIFVNLDLFLVYSLLLVLALFAIGLARLYNLYDFCELPYIDEIFSYALHLYILYNLVCDESLLYIC